MSFNSDDLFIRYKNCRPSISNTIKLSLNDLQCQGGSRFVASSPNVNAVVASGNDALIIDHSSLSPSHQSFHSDVITDLEFSPFVPHHLASVAKDQNLKIWKFNSDQNVKFSSELSFLFGDCALAVHWHPAVGGLTGVATSSNLIGVDIDKHMKLFQIDSKSAFKFQSFCWGYESGNILCSTGDDKKIRLYDPRATLEPSTIISSALCSSRDSAVYWLGDSQYFIVSSLENDRRRNVTVWDSIACKSVRQETFDASSGLMVPMFDPDTSMLFLLARSSSFVQYYHFTPNSSSCLRQCDQWRSNSYLASACLMSKFSLALEDQEVNRIATLSKNGILSFVSWKATRKEQKFHPELYPPTGGRVPACAVNSWLEGNSSIPAKEEMKPGVNLGKKDIPKNGNAMNKNGTKDVITNGSEIVTIQNGTAVSAEACDQHSNENGDKRTYSGFSTSSSKFKHIEISISKKSHWIENLPSLSTIVPSYSDMMAVNSKRVALPLKTVGGASGGGTGAGVVLVVELKNEGQRLQDAGLPVIANGPSVLDLVFSPFDDSRLLVGSEDGGVREWTIPDGGVKMTMNEPSSILQAHSEKIYFVRFHPLVSNLIATSSYDMTVKLWSWPSGSTPTLVTTLVGFQDEIFCCCFSFLDPYSMITVSKDKMIRKYDLAPVNHSANQLPSLKCSLPIGHRGCRVFLACGDSLAIVCAFSEGHAQRQIIVLDAVTFDIKTVMDMDSSPSIPIPFYDIDTSVVFLTGRGDSVISAFEVTANLPYLQPLSGFNAGSSLHQCVSFLHKRDCNVTAVEIATALRLCPSVIQPLSVKVPRVRTQFFQDDLFPNATPTWKPTCDITKFLSGQSILPLEKISLRPSHMTALSMAPTQAKSPKKYDFATELQKEKSEENKKEELLAAMRGKLVLEDQRLPQDDMDGVDSDEWDD